MAALALVLTLAWVGLVAGVPSYRRLRRAGDVGIDTRDRRGSAQWWARRISILGVGLAVAAPVAELAGLRPVPALDQAAVHLVGSPWSSSGSS